MFGKWNERKRSAGTWKIHLLTMITVTLKAHHWRMDKRDLISLPWKTKLSSIYDFRGATIACCSYENRNEEREEGRTRNGEWRVRGTSSALCNLRSLSFFLSLSLLLCQEKYFETFRFDFALSLSRHGNFMFLSALVGGVCGSHGIPAPRFRVNLVRNQDRCFTINIPHFFKTLLILHFFFLRSSLSFSYNTFYSEFINQCF